jgi:hypothetical protein
MNLKHIIGLQMLWCAASKRLVNIFPLISVIDYLGLLILIGAAHLNICSQINSKVPEVQSTEMLCENIILNFQTKLIIFTIFES